MYFSDVECRELEMPFWFRENTKYTDANDSILLYTRIMDASAFFSK